MRRGKLADDLRRRIVCRARGHRWTIRAGSAPGLRLLSCSRCRSTLLDYVAPVRVALVDGAPDE